jgi:hypothetical protein
MQHSQLDPVLAVATYRRGTWDVTDSDGRKVRGVTDQISAYRDDIDSVGIILRTELEEAGYTVDSIRCMATSEEVVAYGSAPVVDLGDLDPAAGVALSPQPAAADSPGLTPAGEVGAALRGAASTAEIRDSATGTGEAAGSVFPIPGISLGPIGTSPIGPVLTETEDIARLHHALRDVELGAYDEQIVRWAARILDYSTLKVLLSWLERVRIAGRTEGGA